MKNQKGITLVALVITIVVLLILAGVTISMVLGPNGVLTNSQKAKDNSAKGTANDALSTALSSVSTDYYTEGGSGTMLEYLKSRESNATKKLASLAPGYTYAISESDGKTTIKMETEKKDYTFTAEITDTLTISSFTSSKDTK